MTDFDSVVMELAQEYQIDDKGFGVGGVLDFAHAIRAHVVEECVKKCSAIEAHDLGHPGTALLVQDLCVDAIRAMTQAGELK